MSLTANPSIHFALQKRVVRPLPRIVLVEARKKSCTSCDTLISSCAQVRSSSDCCSHSHRVCRAMEVSRRLGIPSPPRSNNLHVVGQATKHFPRMEPSFPVHRNLRQMLLISSIAHGGKPSTMIVYMGISMRTDLTQIWCPLLAMSGPWHAGSIVAMDSTVDWIMAFWDLLCAQREA